MDILGDREVIALGETLKKNSSERKYLVSDLILEKDGKTYQFVDIVMEGGGVLGIALVGYIYALELADIRFLGVGGSSVGGIVSLLLMCCGWRTEEKGAALADMLSKMELSSLVDGGPFSSRLCRRLGSENPYKNKLFLAFLIALSGRTLIKKLGLNPGDRFFSWLTDCLAEYGIHTLEDARKKIEYIPDGLTHRLQGSNFRRPVAELKIVAADLTTSSKVVFPEMAQLYWENPNTINPALFARASMSIPGFFQPMEVTGVRSIVNSTEKWDALCSFDGTIPDRIYFADGGLLSNFPISLFHRPNVPNAPTFGAKLGSAKRVVNEIESVFGYGVNLVTSMWHCSDYDFIYQNPDYHRLITYIPTDGHNCLNFFMSDEEKLVLFRKGMIAAIEFLDKFDWPAYKEVRRIQQAAAEQ